MVDRLLDRLEDVRRGFPVAAVVGGAAAAAAARLAGGRAGVARLLHIDDSPGMLARAARLQQVSACRAGVCWNLRSVCVAPHAVRESYVKGVELDRGEPAHVLARGALMCWWQSVRLNRQPCMNVLVLLCCINLAEPGTAP